MRFDIEAEMKKNPPKLKHKAGVFDDERIRAWLDKLIRMRDAGVVGITNRYVAEVLTKGARAEGIIAQDAAISESNVARIARRHEAAQKK